MPHHYQKSITEAPEWCKTCHRITAHFVSDGRLGRCKEHEPPGLVDGMTKAQRERRKRQEKEQREPTLF